MDQWGFRREGCTKADEKVVYIHRVKDRGLEEPFRLPHGRRSSF